jgi:hypothetical protein
MKHVVVGQSMLAQMRIQLDPTREMEIISLFTWQQRWDGCRASMRMDRKCFLSRAELALSRRRFQMTHQNGQLSKPRMLAAITNLMLTNEFGWKRNRQFQNAKYVKVF